MGFHRPDGSRSSVTSDNITFEDIGKDLVPILERIIQYDRNQDVNVLKAAFGLMTKHRKNLDKLETRMLNEIEQKERAIKRAMRR